MNPTRLMNVLVFVSLLMVFSGSAMADTELDIELCNDNSLIDSRIEGCSRLISSGKLDRENLASAYYNRGDAHAARGQFDPAIQDYDEAIRLNPQNADAYNNRGTAYGTRGEYDRAIQDYIEALRLDPDSATALSNLQKVFERQDGG